MAVSLKTIPDSDIRLTPIDGDTKQMLREAGKSKFDFGAMSVEAAGNESLKRSVQNAVVKQDYARDAGLKLLPDSEAMRTLAGNIKAHTLEHLDYYLEQFERNVRARGGHVHLAKDGDEAKKIIMDIVARAGCKRVIKSKSMASEEIELAHAMEAIGLDVVETDLGEFIVQINHDKPSHIVTPIIHMNKAAIAKLFSEYFRTPYNDDPLHLTKQAREYLRDKFRKADLGMTGGNFLVAETGQICCVENEGNVRQSTTTPRVLVSLVGIEKLVPRVADLSVMLKLLARSATGQPMTIYTSIFGGPRREGETDGPEEFHVVLLDNGRSEILAGDYRETLQCIRCGACLNACPIYRSIGGHSYGSVYPGPIGALITPLFQGLSQFKDLPNASSLCGACYEACPVKINIPKHLINLRRDIVARHISNPIERFIYRAWAWTMGSQTLYKLSSIGQTIGLRAAAKNGWIHRLPPPASAWTKVRPIPEPPRKTFRQVWAKGRG
jgi:L-lactate dehydrogenase complex protein LldF